MAGVSYTDVQIPLLWAAPEVVQLHKYTIKSDVWSFGVFMVELFIYGERPYGGITVIDIYYFYLFIYYLFIYLFICSECT